MLFWSELRRSVDDKSADNKGQAHEVSDGNEESAGKGTGGHS